jgi:hypothetical protein
VRIIWQEIHPLERRVSKWAVVELARSPQEAPKRAQRNDSARTEENIPAGMPCFAGRVADGTSRRRHNLDGRRCVAADNQRLLSRAHRGEIYVNGQLIATGLKKIALQPRLSISCFRDLDAAAVKQKIGMAAAEVQFAV